MSPPELPYELVCEILCHVVPPPLHVKQDLKKLEWPLINNLSLSSRQFRRAVLKCWFSSVFVREPSDWDMIRKFPSVQIVKVVSRLHVFADALDPDGIPRLSSFEKLKTLSVNMHVLWSKFPDNLHLVRDLVPHMPPTLTDLEISCMSPEHCNSALLASIASACPQLRRLGFYSAASDCTACAEEITLPFPIPVTFPSAVELAVSLGDSLSSLKHLRSLALPIHLSHADIYDMHLSGGHPLRRSLDRESNCPRCVADYGPSTKENEQTVADHLGEKIPSLHYVQFASWVYGNGKGGVRLVRTPPGDGLMKDELVTNYIETQEWDGGKMPKKDII